jgi:carbonic anhydrase/acetyltransferase-like protein (isoleucine patch superfamily)
MAPILEPYKGQLPRLAERVYCHDNVVLIGDIEVGRGSNLWPGVVLRGDQGSIRIGEETSIQDGTIIHATRGLSHTTVGSRVTVGHRVVLHGCTIEDEVLVGMGAIVMDNAVVGAGSIIGAGALVPPGKVIPPRSLVVGVPGTIKRRVGDEEFQAVIVHSHREYARLAAEYGGWDPPGADHG